MRANKIILSAFILMLTLVNQAFAVKEVDHYLNGPEFWPLDLSGPLNGIRWNTVLGFGSAPNRICAEWFTSYDLEEVILEPLVQPTGVVNGNVGPNSPTYDTGVKGISFAPYMGWYTSLDNMGTETRSIYKGWISDYDRKRGGASVNMMTSYYKDAEPFVGEAIMTKKPIVRFTCIDTNRVVQEIHTYWTRPWPVTGKVTSCVPNESAAVINMNNVGVVRFEKADPSTLIETTQADFSLVCDPNIKLNISITDLSDTTNTSDTATLTADSTAKGVGFAVTTPKGNRMRFGIDSPTPSAPGAYHYLMLVSGREEVNPVSMSLGFSYVRKPGEDVVPGTAKALIGLTYSYQ